MADERIPKLLIIASMFVVHCAAHTTMIPLNETTRLLIEEAKASKHPRCFTPYNINCNVTEYPDYDFDITRWYYSVTSRVCFPLFLPQGENKFCAGIIDWVINLPYTKKECEDLCGEPCTMYHYNNMAESGICMIDCQIPIPKGKPFPCLPSQYGCCPRDYEPPNNNSDNSTFTITKTLFNMTDPKIAKRYNYF